MACTLVSNGEDQRLESEREFLGWPDSESQRDLLTVLPTTPAVQHKAVIRQETEFSAGKTCSVGRRRSACEFRALVGRPGAVHGNAH